MLKLQTYVYTIKEMKTILAMLKSLAILRYPIHTIVSTYVAGDRSVCSKKCAEKVYYGISHSLWIFQDRLPTSSENCAFSSPTTSANTRNWGPHGLRMSQFYTIGKRRISGHNYQACSQVGFKGVQTNRPCSLAKFIFNETAAVQGTII